MKTKILIIFLILILYIIYNLYHKKNNIENFEEDKELKIKSDFINETITELKKEIFTDDTIEIKHNVTGDEIHFIFNENTNVNELEKNKIVDIIKLKLQKYITDTAIKEKITQDIIDVFDYREKQIQITIPEINTVKLVNELMNKIYLELAKKFDQIFIYNESLENPIFGIFAGKNCNFSNTKLLDLTNTIEELREEIKKCGLEDYDIQENFSQNDNFIEHFFGLLDSINEVIDNIVENCPSPSCGNKEECPSPSCGDDEEECPSPSCGNQKETSSSKKVKNVKKQKEDACPSPSCDDKTEEVKTDFFISNLPSKELLKKSIDKLKDILGIKKDIKSEVKDEQIIFTIPDMKIEDLNKNPDTKNKLIKEVRDIFMDRLKKLGKTFKREQINVKFISGSVKVIVEILSLEEVEAKNKSCNGNITNRNYIQYKPIGKNGLFVPRTEIGDTTGELNKLFQEASNIGGMTLN